MVPLPSSANRATCSLWEKSFHTAWGTAKVALFIPDALVSKTGSRLRLDQILNGTYDAELSEEFFFLPGSSWTAGAFLLPSYPGMRKQVTSFESLVLYNLEVTNTFLSSEFFFLT